jgi:ribosomal protein L6P/L9E
MEQRRVIKVNKKHENSLRIKYWKYKIKIRIETKRIYLNMGIKHPRNK